MTLRIFEIIFPIFAIVFVGMLYGRRFRPDMTLPNRLNMDIFIPALLFVVLIEQADNAGIYVNLAIGAFLVTLISGLIALPVSKLLNIDPKTFCPPMMFGNSGNMGLPLTVMAFGEEAFPAGIVVFLVSTFLHISLGSYLLDRRAHLLQLLVSPMVLAVIAAVIISMTGFQMNETVMKPIDMLGQICIPLMLFALGVRLADVDLSEWHLGLISGILAPVIGVATVLIALPFIEMTKMQQGVLFMFGALPPAVMNFMFAEHYNQEPVRVAAIVLIANAFSLISIPLALVYALPKFG